MAGGSENQPSKNKAGFGAFVRRHKDLLTFVGAFVAFAGYVTKEGFREELKSVADAIESAESVLLIRSDLSNLEWKVATILEHLEPQPANATGIHHAKPHTKDYVREDYDRCDDLRREIETAIEKVRPLAEELPPKTPEVHHFESMQSKFKIANDKFDSLQEPFAAVMHPADCGEDPKCVDQVSLPPKLEDDFATLRREFEGMSPSLFSVSSDLLSAARKIEKTDREWYDFSKKASYGLYTVGFLLGLVGRVYGVEGVSPD